VEAQDGPVCASADLESVAVADAEVNEESQYARSFEASGRARGRGTHQVKSGQVAGHQTSELFLGIIFSLIHMVEQHLFTPEKMIGANDVEALRGC